jgi:hypothetical protein
MQRLRQWIENLHSPRHPLAVLHVRLLNARDETNLSPDRDSIGAFRVLGGKVYLTVATVTGGVSYRI